METLKFWQIQLVKTRNKMKKLILIFLCIFSLTAANAFAVEVAWMYVQQRHYGDGRNINRLSFGLIDDLGNYLADDDRVTGVTLYDPSGKSVELSPHKFGATEELVGFFDPKNSQWSYNPDWRLDSWFSSDILEPLISGMYRLKVSTLDGKATERIYKFNRRISLPMVDSRTVQLRGDQHGNLIWTWDIPLDLGYLSFGSRTSAKAAIDIYRNDQNVAYFSVTIPSQMGFVFIPYDIVQKLNQKGDRFEFEIKLETRDKNNRTYSKPFIIKGVLPAEKDDR
jgi:hypothetical protein